MMMLLVLIGDGIRNNREYIILELLILQLIRKKLQIEILRKLVGLIMDYI